MSWLMRHRSLVRRYDFCAEHFTAFTTIACALNCHRRLLELAK
jgi:hypothetical protein